MFMSTACLWLLTLQDVHNSVLKVCSLAFFEQFTGMLRNMKDPGNGKQTGNEWKKCHRSTGTAGTGVTTARSLFGTCSPTTNSPGVPTRRRRENLSWCYLRHHNSPAGYSPQRLNFDLPQIHLFSMADPLGRRSESISLNCRLCAPLCWGRDSQWLNRWTTVERYWKSLKETALLAARTVTIKMFDHFSIGVFCQRCARNTAKR